MTPLKWNLKLIDSLVLTFCNKGCFWEKINSFFDIVAYRLNSQNKWWHCPEKAYWVPQTESIREQYCDNFITRIATFYRSSPVHLSAKEFHFFCTEETNHCGTFACPSHIKYAQTNKSKTKWFCNSVCGRTTNASTPNNDRSAAAAILTLVLPSKHTLYSIHHFNSVSEKDWQLQ